MAVAIPCSLPHTGGRGVVPGSFLKPLIWWDERNGTNLAGQLNNADSALLHYEALRHAEWMLAK
jgi:hypothetical protein